MCVGVPNVSASWDWQNAPAELNARRLSDILTHRHLVAHGVDPRPQAGVRFANDAIQFLRRHARTTDDAVRVHLTTAHAHASPWPV